MPSLAARPLLAIRWQRAPVDGPAAYDDASDLHERVVVWWARGELNPHVLSDTRT